MIPLDELVPNYRRARDHWPRAPTLAAHYATVEEAYSGSGQSLIEAVKSYVECVCRTILADGGAFPPENTNTTSLLGAAIERLGLRKARGASRFDSVLSAHNKLADALTDARNHEGPIAHGKDGFLDALANHHVRLYLLTGDTILSLLLGALEGSEPNLIHTREPYEHFGHLNSAIDASVRVSASTDDEDGSLVLRFQLPGLEGGIDLRYAPSQLLYGLDRHAYVTILESAPSSVPTMVESSEIEAKSEVPTLFSDASRVSVRPSIVREYTGRFDILTAPLKQFLLAQGIRERDAHGVLGSLLAAFDESAVLDWSVREPMRARVVVAMKRVLRQYGLKHPPPEKLAAMLVEWLIAEEAIRASRAGAGRRTKADQDVSVTEKSLSAPPRSDSDANTP